MQLQAKAFKTAHQRRDGKGNTYENVIQGDPRAIQKKKGIMVALNREKRKRSCRQNRCKETGGGELEGWREMECM